MTGLTRLRPVIENLLSAQRALTRAVAMKDGPARTAALAERDRCSQLLEEAFKALEIAHAAAVEEQQRLAARESNLSHILSVLHHQDPAGVGQILEDALVRLDEDQRFNETFLTRLGEAIEDGLAIRRGDQVRITYAGVLELVTAKRIRSDLDRVRTQAFNLEKQLRAAREAQSLPTQPRQLAAGA